MIEACRENFNTFMTQFCYTRDEHDRDNPIKKFPTKLYLQDICYTLSARVTDAAGKTWPKYPIIFDEKSRQILMSWVLCGYLLWDANFYDGRLNVVQSVKDDLANKLIERMWHIHENLPYFMQSPAKQTWCSIKFYTPAGTIRSEINGIPQGSEQIRSMVPSILFMDEAAQIPGFRAAYTAAKPAITGGGQLVAVSSAWPLGEYRDFVLNEIEDGQLEDVA